MFLVFLRLNILFPMIAFPKNGKKFFRFKKEKKDPAQQFERIENSRKEKGLNS